MDIELRHIWKHKILQLNNKSDKVTILSDVNIDFCGTCVQMIIGPSGSGKTTLLRLLNKLESPDEGEIIYQGKEIQNIPAQELRKDIAMVFQTPALFRGSIYENISYGPVLHKNKISREKVAELLKVVLLDEMDQDRNVENLSQGQQQRISLARALANDPKVLLLDEPTSALDPSAANTILDLIQKINREMGITIIMVTHVMEHAKRIADKICLIAGGRVVETNTSDSFFEHPKSDVAKKFIRGEL